MTFRLRRKRSGKIIDLIETIFEKRKNVNIVDIGGTIEYWDIVPRDYLLRRNVHITLVNLSPTGNLPAKNDAVFSYVQGDGCRLKDIKDNQCV